MALISTKTKNNAKEFEIATFWIYEYAVSRIHVLTLCQRLKLQPYFFVFYTLILYCMTMPLFIFVLDFIQK